MTNNRNSVSYMTKYLRYALEFEKNVYIWTETMNTVNKQMQHIYDRRNEEKKHLHLLENTGTVTPRNNANEESEIKKINTIKKAVLIISIITTIIFFAIGCIMGYHLQKDVLAALFYGFALIITGTLATGVLPIMIIIYIYFHIKLQKINKATKNMPTVNNLEDNSYDDEMTISLTLAELDIDEESLIITQEKISKNLNEARATLQNIYNLNILPNKYRNFATVATLYEYLSTGRCNTIQGHGGIYDTYETERIQIEQLNQLILMNRTLQRIEDYNRCIYQEMQKANKTLTMIKCDLESIGRSVNRIETNTAISAHANQQSADSLSWIKWNEWSRN